MKKIIFFIALILIFFHSYSQTFTYGNIVVLQIGDAVGTLTSSGNPVFLKEYSPLGTLTASLALPTGTNPLILGGAATSEGGLMLSPNNSLLSLGAYSIAPNSSTVSLASSSSTYIPRVAVGIDANGVITRTASTSFFSANNIRSSATDGIGNYWCSGANTGISYFGTNTVAVTTGTQTTNTRCINIFNNNLYFSASSGTALGIVQVGSGLATTAGQTNSLIINAATGASSYGFYFNPTQTICYVADDRTTSSGGVQKWVYSSGTWTLAYTLGTGVTNIGARGVIADFSGTNPIIYGTSAEAANNRIFKVIDNGSTATASTIATATTNTIFRGLAFSPCLTPTIASISSNTTLCSGQSYNFSVTPVNSGNMNYAWAGPGTLSSYTINNPVLSSAVSGDYTISLANGCGTSSTVVTISVNPNPTITVPTLSVCAGLTATLFASGANSYTWSNASNSSSLVLSPTANVIYTVTGTSAFGCTNSNTTGITVYGLPTISVNSSTICSGNQSTLTASGAITYTWSTNSNGIVVSVNPIATTVYTVSGTDNNGCVNNSTTTVNVISTPTITINSVTICTGQTATLNASGASSYTWNTSSTNSTIVDSPTTTTIYSVTGSNLGCIGNNNATITVNALPTISVNQATVCSGTSVTLTATGANNYNWNTGSTSNSILVTPTTNLSYTITGTTNSCSSTGTTNITVYNLPFISLNTATVCAGNTATLSALGANTFTWSNASNANSISVSPTVSTVYSISGTSSLGCVGNNSTSVTVNPLPNLVVPSLTICAGSTATLIASGASTYTWSNNVSSNSIAVTPSVNTNYTVTATSVFGCTNFATPSVAISASLSLNVNSPSLCIGNSTTLSVTGATSYSWSNSSNASSIVVNPTVNTTYTVSGTNASGCSGIATSSVFVNSFPTVAVTNATICSGLNATITANGASTYSWSNGANSSSVVISPSISTNYTVTGTTQGCSSNATTQILVNATPTLSLNSATICSGNISTLTVSGAATYTWSNGSNSASINPTPSITTSYSVAGTSLAGCVSTNSTSVTVNPIPLLTINTATVCSGNSATLIASGANTYSWSNTSNTSSIIISPTTTTNYTLNGTSLAGCTNTATVQVIVNSLPTITVNSPTVCFGQSATITASGAATYTWNNNNTNPSVILTPTVSTIYSVTGTSSLGCTKTMSTLVIVNPLPAITVNSASLCNGNSFTIVANGATTYSWNNGTTSSSIIVTPSASTNYSVIGSVFGCTSQAVSILSVTPSPTISVNSASICLGGNTILFASGANTYTWNNGSNSSSITLSPISTTNYTVSGTQSGCTNSTITTVTVYSLPTVIINNSTVICLGGTLNLTANGANGYTWSSGALTSSISVSPTITTNYSVIGVSAQGCSNSAMATVTVNALPTVSLNLLKNSFCKDDAINITYTATPSNGTISGIPNSYNIGTYTITYAYTATNNCSASANKVITVNACTALKENWETNAYSIYPNPFSNVISISGFQSLNGCLIEVYNLNGERIFIQNTHESSASINLETLVKGLYIFRISENNHTTSYKLMKE